nr:hypothetical protein [Streptomyces chartreusis]
MPIGELPTTFWPSAGKPAPFTSMIRFVASAGQAAEVVRLMPSVSVPVSGVTDMAAGASAADACTTVAAVTSSPAVPQAATAEPRRTAAALGIRSVRGVMDTGFLSLAVDSFGTWCGARSLAPGPASARPEGAAGREASRQTPNPVTDQAVSAGAGS